MSAQHEHHHQHSASDTGEQPPLQDESQVHRGDHGATPHGDHSTHAGHSVDAFRKRFWISLILSIPVILYSEMVQHWFGFTMPEFSGSHLVAPILGTVVFVQGGSVFLEGGWREIQRRQPGMMLLISLAILVAFGASLATTFGWLDLDFWWELVLLITIMLLGHWLEMRSIAQAEGALDALAALLPDTAERIDSGDKPATVPVNDLQANDLILVRPGASVPVDGIVEAGTADLDESMLTGESRPVTRGPGDTVIAGSVVSSAALRVRVTAVGEQTQLAGIQRLVADAQASKSGAQVLADRMAAILFYVAIAAGLITFLVWSLLGDINEAITRTVTVLVISCPHALGLAIPLVVSISTSLAARNGMLIRDRMALERMRQITVVLFDKTGTLTEGRPQVSGVATANASITEQDLMAIAAAAEADSEHPLARAIVEYVTVKEIAIPKATEFQSIAGHGVQAQLEQDTIRIGGPAMLQRFSFQPPASLTEWEAEWAERGATVLHVVREHEVIGAVALTDTIRPESREAVADLQSSGVDVAMVTGDSKEVAQAVADKLGITRVMAGVLPDGKQNEVLRLQAAGESVAIVGDGVNDAPALAQADIGIAIGAGTDVAIASAGVVLVSSDPRAVVGIRKLSTATYRKMVQNLVWAVGYNVFAIPLAAGAFAWAGVVVGPAVGAVMMSISTIIVALNAQLLRRVSMQPVES